MNPTDAWAAHALAHVYEMEGRYTEGLKFIESTEKNWAVSAWGYAISHTIASTLLCTQGR